MPKELPSIQTPSESPTANYSPSWPETLSHVGYQAANFIIPLAIISTSVALVQSPINTLLLKRIQQNNRPIPSPSSEMNVGFFMAARSLYTGMGANLAGSGARTAYVTGVKKSGYGTEVVEETSKGGEEGLLKDVLEQKRDVKTVSINSFARVGYVAAVSLGDVVITNFHDTKSALLKLGTIDARFKSNSYHSLFKMGTSGMGARYGAAMVNFSALCMGEEYVSSWMPEEEHSKNHFISGAISGMFAAVFSLPFSYYRDYALSKVTVSHGKLVTPSTRGLIADALVQAKAAGFAQTVKDMSKRLLVDAPLRMGRTGAVFGLVTGISDALGAEPLACLSESIASTKQAGKNVFRFFSGSENTSHSMEKGERTEPPGRGWF